MKFRLLAGIHVGRDPEDTRDPKALKPGERMREVTYHVGDIVEDPTDLCERLGSQKFAPVYEKQAMQAAPVPRNTNPGVDAVTQLDGKPQNPVETSEEVKHGAAAKLDVEAGVAPAAKAPTQTDDLDGKTLAQLRDLAVAEKIKANGASTKEAMVEVIRAARGPRV